MLYQEMSLLWDWRQMQYRFVSIDDIVFGIFYHVASYPRLTAMDRALSFALTTPRPLGIDNYDRFTPMATVYPHLVFDRSVRALHECPDGGFMAVTLYTEVVARWSNDSSGVRQDAKWCSTGCMSRATGMGPGNLGIEYLVIKFGTLDEMCDWFARHRCAECDRYLACLIRPRSFGGDDPPTNGQFFVVPLGYGTLWDPSFMKTIAHH